MALPSSFEAPFISDMLSKKKGKKPSYGQTVVEDYWLALVSRELSLQGRREVLTGKAKFGVFGDGKELPQIAMAKVFRVGDYRAGYYRDQTLMMALGLTSVEDFLAQMYGDTENDPYSGGRQMTGHFATPFINKEGDWINQQDRYNISSGISCTAGQMGRAMGLAYASKVYRAKNSKEIDTGFSKNGNEVCFCTIGDASTSEGVFWETVNAASVEEIPLVIAVWDDGYGISVPTDLQTTKGSISRALEGFLKEGDTNGINLYTVDGYDYPELCIAFERATKKARKKHIPAVVHVKNLTQQQGHSTSGSHERYKSKERLQWEHEFDCIRQMEKWMLCNDLISSTVITEMQREARTYVRERKHKAWDKYQAPKEILRNEFSGILSQISFASVATKIKEAESQLKQMVFPAKSEILQLAKRIIYLLHSEEIPINKELTDFVERVQLELKEHYGTDLLATGIHSSLNIPVIHPEYDADPELVNGYQLINKYFDYAFSVHDNLYAFGEDVGVIGDVNQGMADLQKKYGKERVFDTGIREWTILGQGAGMAMRGLRPIAEIQYLDYLVYALPFLTDDVATLRYRSNGQQQVPMIIRTRGHRLEGIWHSGSPLGMMIHSLRGIHICVPRNMTQAAGMYNTLLHGNDPGIMVECLNGYRLKEAIPSNLGEFNVALGMPEIVLQGEHLTLVTYGSCVKYALDAADIVRDFGIAVEVVDVQTLLPFDLEHIISGSIKKTSKVLFLDEDVPGGASAYMMQQVIEEQGAFKLLDGPPETMSAQEHRTPYGSDGDYYAKPQVEDIVERIYQMVFETKMY
ncbi:MAG: pyruvate/2-oxoglutarate/acetoin dehydrogenase E1 component/TPP-dependent pyruvate [Saprospiraceae bacterium]|jgi:pyruvate/2-oxoglutarate/acetoin dehydrogenase E1 component/TPP-dependent pyruvate/acetoin dehydrogenase alpha subunit